MMLQSIHRMRYTIVLCIMMLPLFHPAGAQLQDKDGYVWPADSLVQKKLDRWQDLKFGMIIHWGLYSVPGIIESWALCSEDWIERDSTISYEAFKKWYWGLINQFNPVRFDPDLWAKTAREAGMKYLVFTTKHHDGFSMFDTKHSDFKITAGPFKNNPRADVTRFVFDAFRKQGFMIGAYFSKPDWHSEYYWWPKYATADRNNNYDIRKYPWRWEQFRQFTFNQVRELMQHYGTVDILWLDGGWVRPRETVNEEVLSWGARIPEWSQDIDLPRIAAMARKEQPGLLVVDRTVHGLYENYQTPEQHIPKEKPDHPWESCMTLANNWGYVPNDQFKPASVIIQTLIEIVAKGGSLLLGIGPRPDGTLPPEAIVRMQEIGKWLSKNGSAIYNTRTTAHYQEGNVFFTRSKSGERMYALVCLPANQPVSNNISWTQNLPAKGSKMTLLETGQTISYTVKQNTVTITLPAPIVKGPALVFSFEPQTPAK